MRRDTRDTYREFLTQLALNTAFGGIIAFNRPVDEATAQAVAKQFVEVVIAPSFDEAARAVFFAKQNVRLLEIPVEAGEPYTGPATVLPGATSVARSTIFCACSWPIPHPLVPKVIVEPFVFGDDNPNDYKIFCARGKAGLIQVDSDRYGHHVQSFYDVRWESGQRLLLNKNVEAAVFANGNRMILTEGLAYDRCTVGVVTDARGHDHLGEFYIDDPEQMYRVLRTQVDVVLSDGVAVLNAADPIVAAMADVCPGSVTFFAHDRSLPAMARHRARGRQLARRPGRALVGAGRPDVVRPPRPVGRGGRRVWRQKRKGRSFADRPTSR